MQINNDNEFEKEFKKSLHQLGELFPVKNSDIDSFEANNIKEITVPDSLNDPTAILKRGKIESLSKKNTIDPLGVDETTNEFRMAARNGVGIPDHILKKMKSDRKKAEDETEREI